MTLTVVSNYINHHQIPLANQLYQQLQGDYTFIQTQPMEEERVKMGWGSEIKNLPYVKLYYEEPESCQKLIMDSDIVMFGGVEDESYIKPRLKAGKIVIRQSERLYREGQWKAISPRGLKKKYEDHTQYAQKEVYLLCNGAYVASDFHIVKAYPDKMFTWGYFPEVKTYDFDRLAIKKTHFDKEGRPQIRIAWAGRFMRLKHPDHAIAVARWLKGKNIVFHMDMIGGGEMEQELHALVDKYNLKEEVSFQGFQPPHIVRRYMEEANIYLFTSDYLEGWGAVVNESMNSGCAVVAGHGIGAVPTLIKSGENGLVYRNKRKRELCKLVEKLATDPQMCRKLGENAYHTMTTEWSPEEAAKRLLDFCEGLLAGEIRACEHGPLSHAPIIAPYKGYQYTKKV